MRSLSINFQINAFLLTCKLLHVQIRAQAEVEVKTVAQKQLELSSQFAYANTTYFSVAYKINVAN